MKKESPRKSAPVPADPQSVAISPWRAELLQTQKRNRIDELLADPNAAERLAALPILDVYTAIKQAGLADSSVLLALAAPEQVQGCLDLDLWHADKLRADRLTEWVAMLVSLGPGKLGSTLGKLDPELVTLFVSQHARVYDVTQEEAPPDDSPHPLFQTPDDCFAIEVTAEGDMGELISRLVGDLYRFDILFAQRTLMAARTELLSNLQEDSYRFRNQRLSDLGFYEHFDALEIYRSLDAKDVRPDEGTAPPADAVGHAQGRPMPGLFIEPLSKESFLLSVLSQISERAPLERLGQGLATLGNRVLSAENVDIADTDEVRAALGRMVGFVSLGLEIISERSVESARQALEGNEGKGGVALVRLFRVGHTIAAKLGRLASAALRHQQPGAGTAAPNDAPKAARGKAPSKNREDQNSPEGPEDLDDLAMEDFLEALAARPPMFRPPGEEARAFASLADIRRATELIETATARLAPTAN